MATNVSFEILDLRHFAAPVLRPVLEAESEIWLHRLHWDYRASSKLLMQYIDSRMLPGYAALESGQVTGYAFCVYEESKAVIGDVFALPGLSPDRADIILAGVAIIDGLMRRLKVNRLQVHDRGVRDGLLLTMLDRSGVPAETLGDSTGTVDQLSDV